jgi:hypothetical protein
MDQLGRVINRKIHGLLLLLVRWGGLRNWSKHRPKKKKKERPQQHPWTFPFLAASGGAMRLRWSICRRGASSAPTPRYLFLPFLFENEHSNPNASCLYLDLWHNYKYIHVLYQNLSGVHVYTHVLYESALITMIFGFEISYLFASPWVLVDDKLLSPKGTIWTEFTLSL